jgi:hypothetical protein
MSGPRALTDLRHEPKGTPLKFEDPVNVGGVLVGFAHHSDFSTYG